MTLPGTPVDLPLPPEVDRVWGYPGDARYVVFYIDTDVDDVIYNDGVRSGTGATWAFQAYRRHRAVEPLLRGFDLNSEHILVVDREASRASVCTGPEAVEFLKRVRPPLPDLTAEQRAEIEAAVAQGWREEKVDHDAISRAMIEQRGRVARMMGWLDMCPSPGQEQSPP